MADLIAEVLALHNTLHTDRLHNETLKAERDRLAQRQDTSEKRYKLLEEETTRLQQMLVRRNSALGQELGLQSSYSKCLSDLAGLL